MKRIRIFLGILALLSVAALCACGGSGNSSTGNIQLNHSSLEMEIGQRTVLELVDGQTPITERVMWLTSDAAVATVDGGLVKAAGAGSCTVKAVYNDREYPCAVTVKADPVFALSQTSAEIIAGKTVQLQMLQDGIAVTEGVKWSSSAPTVASVKDGLVTAKKEGKATVTASCFNHEYQCEITVLAAESVRITNTAQSVVFDAPTSEKQDTMSVLSAKISEKFTLECSTMNDSALHFSSSDESVATIDSKTGAVLPVKAGVTVLAVESATLGPNGEVYGDNVVLLVKDSGSSRTESCYQAAAQSYAVRLNLRENGTFEYYAVENANEKKFAIVSYCAGVYTENAQGIVLYWLEEGAVHGYAASAQQGGFGSEEIAVNGVQQHLDFTSCAPSGKYHCEINVSEMNETFHFDLTLEENGTYVYFRQKSEAKEEGVVNSGTWSVQNGNLVFAYDGGEMLFQIVNNSCIQSVNAIPTGGMDAKLTFFIV